MVVAAQNKGKGMVCLVFGGGTVQGGSDGGGRYGNWEVGIKTVGIEDLF